MSQTINASTSLRTSMLGAVKTLLAGGEIRAYGGIRPASSDDSLGAAVLLCTIKKDGTTGITLDDTVAGLLTIPAGHTWTGTNSNSGTATFFRICQPADVGDASVSAPRLQGTIGVVGADLNLDTVALVSGQPTPVSSFNIGVYAQLP